MLREKDDANYYYNQYQADPTQENLDLLIKYRPQDHYDEINKNGALGDIHSEKKQIPHYDIHELAELFPPISKDKLKELAQNIKKNGLIQPIVLFENKILDGRNRYLACKLIGVKPKVIQYELNIDPLDYVIAENLHRRHLNGAQIADIAWKSSEILQERAKEKQTDAQHKLPTLQKQQPVLSSEDKTDTHKTREEKPIHVRKQLAKKWSVSEETLHTSKKVNELNDPQINKKWEQAKQGKTTIKAVKMAIDKKVKPKTIPKIPQDKYDLIYADPPWEYNFTETPTRSIEKEYPTMSLKDICKLKVPSADDCVLFLWCTSPKLYPEGMEVIKAWGFTYKTSMVWIKDKIGMGYYARSRHEFILIATKGKPGVPEPENRFDSVIEQPRTEHSKKPEIVYEMIEKMYPNKKKIELFARNERSNWKSWGNEIESE